MTTDNFLTEETVVQLQDLLRLARIATQGTEFHRLLWRADDNPKSGRTQYTTVPIPGLILAVDRFDRPEGDTWWGIELTQVQSTFSLRYDSGQRRFTFLKSLVVELEAAIVASLGDTTSERRLIDAAIDALTPYDHESS